MAWRLLAVIVVVIVVLAMLILLPWETPTDPRCEAHGGVCLNDTSCEALSPSGEWLPSGGSCDEGMRCCQRFSIAQ